MIAKLDAADVQVGVVHADAARDRRRVNGIGQVPGLGGLHRVDVLGREEVPAAVAVRVVALTPPSPQRLPCPMSWSSGMVMVGRSRMMSRNWRPKSSHAS
jgi:hypothetical protein